MLIKIAWSAVEKIGIIESSKLLQEEAEKTIPNYRDKFNLEKASFITIMNAIGTAVDGIEDVASISVMMNTLLGSKCRKEFLDEYSSLCQEIILALVKHAMKDDYSLRVQEACLKGM